MDSALGVWLVWAALAVALFWLSRNRTARSSRWSGRHREDRVSRETLRRLNSEDE